MRALFALLFAVALLTAHAAHANPFDGKRTYETIMEAGGTELSGEEIQDLIAGNTVTFDNPDRGYTIHVFYDSNGERRYLYSGQKVVQEWWVDDDMRCFESMRGGSPCAKVVREADGALRFCEDRSDFACQADVTVTPGNPRGL